MDSSRNAGQRLPVFSPPLLLLPFFPHFPPICSILFFNFFLLAHQTVVGVVVPIQHHRRINAQLSPATFGEERRQHAERPDALKQAWQELLELRANQSAYADREFPVDRRLLGSLRRCGSNPNTEAIPSSASMLSPKLIGIYAEVGHLTRICPERGRKEVDDADAMDLGELLEDFRQQCSLSLSAFPELPSLAQIFGTFGSPIDLAQSGAEHKDLQGWTREIVGQIESIPGHEERWKLLVIAPGLHDIPPGQSAHRLAQSVLQSVHIVRHRLPRRTFLLILRHSHFAFWHTLARASAFCAKVMEHWEWQEPELGEKAWEEVETRISVNFQSEDFHVEIADLMDVGRPLPGPDGLPDVSVLGPDCAHLSARGLSLLHAQLWNWLLQPRARSQPFVPLVRPLLCPRPHCPFLLTARNRLACPRLPPLLTSAGGSGRAGRDQQSSRAGTEAWAALSPLALLLASALLLYALLAGCSLMPSLSAGSSPRGANSPVQQSEPLMRLAS